MAASQVCRFFKYGYCYFHEMCRFEHVNDLCQNSECEVRTCRKRNPKTCIFFKESGYCKFGSSCQYKHKTRNCFAEARHQEDLATLLSQVQMCINVIVPCNDA